MSSQLIVVKVGTASLTKNDGILDKELMGKLVDQIAQAIKQGNKIVFVTSGAVAAGIAELEIPPKPNDIVFQQVCAATGQSIIMSIYRELFKKHNLKVAQILLTAEDLSNRAAYLHICDVLELALQLGIVPIINENDVTSTDELIPITKGYEVNFSDNDNLSVLVANALEADMVIILSNVDGLYTMHPKKQGAKLIKTVEQITPELKCEIEGKSKLGRGGMKTKLKAAEVATESGVPLVIANSQKENVITDILAGKQVGTLFKAQQKLPGIKRWIAYGASVKGKIFVNEGAKNAILKGGSLLPVGIINVEGNFNEGDVVCLVDHNRNEFAKANPNYNSSEISIIKSLKTNQIKKVLGYIRHKEVVARKNICLLKCEI
ncbi:MAG: glutamate 5-kinase [Candidatus Bathyarchaeota archaeon]|nr:glutamate 5-kinase [Candidatus Bathyarchaeum tardum]WGM89205.1 MAG: glutamate 5-kinase [Candidatus Bathyarchaeum tardum]